MNGAMDRLQAAGWRVRGQQARMRAGRLERRNDRLRDHAASLQAELDRAREARKEEIDRAKGERGMSNGRGGAMKLLVVGGVAYILGAKAGRDRYEQIVSWARRVRAKGEDTVEQLREGEPMATSTERAASASLGVTSRGNSGRTTAEV